MLFYFIPSALVFGVFMSALWINESEPAHSTDLWTCIIAASLLWPATLPSMLAKASTVVLKSYRNPLAE